MEWVEVTGATVTEAQERALDQLGVDITDAEIEVVEADQAGNRLIRADSDGTIELIDFTTMTSSLVTNFGVVINHIEFVEGNRAVAVLQDGAFWLLDLERGERIGLLAELGSGLSTTGDLVTSLDGTTVWLATATEITEVQIDEDAWIDRACQLANRELTDEEWARFMPGQFERRPACP